MTTQDDTLSTFDLDAMTEGAATAHLWADAYTWRTVAEIDPTEQHVPADATELHPANLDAPECIPEDVWDDALRHEIAEDVADWAQDNAADVARYMKTTGRDESHVGHDFALSRNGHGTSLRDRGAGAVGDRLHNAAKVYGEFNVLVTFDADGDVARVEKL